MSKHWDPRGKFAPFGPVRTSWHGANQPRPKLPSYLRLQEPAGRRVPEAAKAGIILGCAVALGVVVGAVLGVREGPPTAPSDAVPVVEQRIESIVPEVVADPEDAAWAARAKSTASTGLPSGNAARNAGVRVAFGSCKWGGGTNCVVDGDTIWIGGRNVRIAGIDAPETHDYRCASELELGERAARQLQALLNSGAVTMTGIDRDHDKYGRLLRNVAVNGQDVGEALMAAGVARAYAGGRRLWC